MFKSQRKTFKARTRNKEKLSHVWLKIKDFDYLFLLPQIPLFILDFYLMQNKYFSSPGPTKHNANNVLYLSRQTSFPHGVHKS